MYRWMSLVLALLLLSACFGGHTPGEPTESTDWDAVDLSALVDDYIDAYLTASLADFDWQGYDQISRESLGRFVAARMFEEQNMGPYYDNKSLVFMVPEDVFEAAAARYFDLPEGYLREGLDWYRPDVESYRVETYHRRSYPDQLVNVGFERAGDRLTISFGRVGYLGRTADSCTVHLAMRGDAPVLLGGERVRRDLTAVCAELNQLGIDLPFETPDALSDGLKYRYALWAIEAEKLHYHRWGAWSGTDPWQEGIPLALPRSVVEEALALRLGEVRFDPGAIEDYDEAPDAFHVRFGSYGGQRSPALRGELVEGQTRTLVMDYVDDTTGGYETRTYVFTVDDEFGWQLRSIHHGVPEEVLAAVGNFAGRDLTQLSIDLDVVGVGVPCGTPDDWTDDEKLNFAMWVISSEELYADAYEAWTHAGTSADLTLAVPRHAVEEALALRLGAVGFDPTGTESYDPGRDVFYRMIGGYGGGRFPVFLGARWGPQLRTVVLKYTDRTSDAALYTRTYTYRVGDAYAWQLVSIDDGVPDWLI